MNKDRFIAVNAMALLTHTITQPLDCVKTRAQMLAEGKTFIGAGYQKGIHGTKVFTEIMNTGAAARHFYSSIDAFLARTVAYSTARVGCFLYWYDLMNHDPRR